MSPPEASGKEATYWISYNRFDGPKSPYRGSEFAISIVLDAGARHRFSAIRVTIVHKEGENFRDVVIRPCHDSMILGFEPGSPTKPNLKQSCLPTSNYRGNLRKFDHASSRTQATSAEVYACVFELVHKPEESCYDLLPLAKTVQAEGAGFPLRIAFDRVWPLEDETVSTVAYFESANHGFFDLSSGRCGCCSPIFLPCHSIRVIPSSRKSRAFDRLSPLIVKTIVSYAFGGEDGWRENLLNFALIQKAWLPAIDLFFEIVGHRGINGGNPIKIARSLQYQPERGHLISAFNDGCLAYFNREEGSTQTELFEALRSILKGGKSSIKRLDLHKAEMVASSGVLRGLKAVESFSLLRLYTFERKDGEGRPIFSVHQLPESQKLDLNTIHGIIQGWRHLKSLVLHQWDSDDQSETLHNRASKLSGPLAELTLNVGALSSRQICDFSSDYLRSVSIMGVTGLTNNDLLEFLESVCTTIEHLLLNDSPVPRRPEEEHALEVVLPRMERLRSLDVRGDQFTSHILTNKYGEFKSTDQLVLGSDSQDPIPLLDLSSALESTSWGHVRIYFTREGYDGTIAAEAERIAKRRGIDLKIYD